MDQPVPAAASALPPFRPITDLVREHALARPGHAALLQGDRRLDWGDFDQLVDRVAAALQRDGIQPTQSIAICGGNSIDYAAVFLGSTLAAGRFTIFGSIFGVVSLSTLQTGLTQLNQPLWTSNVVEGLVLAVAVFAASRGWRGRK